MQYEKLRKVSIRDHPALRESWVQERIAEDPAMLGLGDVVVRDKERIHQGAGRLDLLLQELDGVRRYEVEIQLGKTDESHIIRTIEYWDIERKRYPQYEHTAVIVAEEITRRFLNVISLFNGMIPLVAIQMTAVQLGETISLLFTKVLDQVRLGLVDEDEEVHESTDRAYWERRGTRATVALTDQLLTAVQSLDQRLELKYNKFYIGLTKNGLANNFVIFRPQKNNVRVEVRLPHTDAWSERIEAAGLDVMDYDSRWGRYRIRITAVDLEQRATVLRELLEAAHRESGSAEL
ncbi:MAG TPA: hypothetical protein PKD27_10730 [Tepidiformaceae bacterium]|nr:hypothetical protein [Tepidiformaceae bacterium]